MSQEYNIQEVKIHDPRIEENREWILEMKAKLLKYCRNKELGADRILDKQYAGLAPYFALWAVENRKEHKKYWVITGDLPNDHLPYEVAGTPRDALRHFSLSWQLKAEKMQQKLEQNDLLMGTPEQHKEMINLLQDRATNLYNLSADDKIWVNPR
jgi:hypothetical protein